jgi:alpha-amylase
MNDNFVDWYGIEAESTALDWTTDIWPAAYVSLKTLENDGYGQEPLNT